MSEIEDVLRYAKYYVEQKHISTLYLHPKDIELIFNHPLVKNEICNKRIFGIPLVYDTGMPRVRDMKDEIPTDVKIPSVSFIGSLPTENVGKWAKTC